MSGFNLPPGVSVNDEHINPGDDTWEQLFDNIAKDCDLRGMADMDCYVAWRLGVECYDAARKLGVKFPHD